MERYVHKVKYYETDKMGITHHSNYVRWMEEARVDFFNRIGLNYKSLELAGLFSPVVSVKCDFKSPTTFEDEVAIEVKIKEFSGVKLILSYCMVNTANGEVVLSGESSHCFTDKDGKLIILKKSYPELNEKLNTVSDL